MKNKNDVERIFISPKEALKWVEENKPEVMDDNFHNMSYGSRVLLCKLLWTEAKVKEGCA